MEGVGGLCLAQMPVLLSACQQVWRFEIPSSLTYRRLAFGRGFPYLLPAPLGLSPSPSISWGPVTPGTLPGSLPESAP